MYNIYIFIYIYVIPAVQVRSLLEHIPPDLRKRTSMAPKSSWIRHSVRSPQKIVYESLVWYGNPKATGPTDGHSCAMNFPLVLKSWICGSKKVKQFESWTTFCIQEMCHNLFKATKTSTRTKVLSEKKYIMSFKSQLFFLKFGLPKHFGEGKTEVFPVFHV